LHDEIDPHYVAVAVKRWRDYTGKSAVLAATGQTFEEAGERGFDGPPRCACSPDRDWTERYPAIASAACG
jgi:hypothetical protein